MNNVSNLYDLLGVKPDASTEEIQKAYRKKAKLHHPDKNDGSEASTEMFKRLGEAKDRLTDPQKRLAYDYFIGVKKRPEPRPQPQFQRTAPQPPPRPQPQTGPGFPTGVAIGVGIGALIVGVALAYFFSDDEDDEDEDEVQ